MDSPAGRRLGRRIAHVDVNAFYCSCERLFRPDLAHTPLVVLSNGDGCVVARDKAVKALGIPMGEPWFKLKRYAQQHGIVAFSSNYTLYGSMSARVMTILRQFSPDVEVYSIDEAFLDLTAQPELRGTKLGREIRARVLRWTGLPVGVGIGRTKTQAKLADWIAKHDDTLGGVCDLTAMPEAQRQSRFSAIAAGEVWGIGRRYAARLAALGLRTVADLMKADPMDIRNRFGVVMERTIRELQGQACLPLTECPPPRQQIVASRTFSASILTADELAEPIREYMGRAAYRLRLQKSVAGAVGIWIETNRFRTHEMQHVGQRTINLPQPTDDTAALTAWAVALMRRIFRPGCRYWKAGVMLLDLAPKDHIQGSLFGDAALLDAGRDTLNTTVDQINDRWGRNTIGIGNAGLAGSRQWSMRRDLLSPRYTTCWAELPVAEA